MTWFSQTLVVTGLIAYIVGYWSIGLMVLKWLRRPRPNQPDVSVEDIVLAEACGLIWPLTLLAVMAVKLFHYFFRTSTA
jgi:hypothetical protein